MLQKSADGFRRWKIGKLLEIKEILLENGVFLGTVPRASLVALEFCGSFSLGIRYFAAHDEPQIWYNWRVVIRKDVDYDVNR